MVKQGNIFWYEYNFLVEWDNFLLQSRCKEIYNYSIYHKDSSIIVMLLLFSPGHWISDIQGITPQTQNESIKPFYGHRQHNWVMFLQAYVTGFSEKFSCLTACQSKSCLVEGNIWYLNTSELYLFSKQLSGISKGKLFSYEQPLNCIEGYCSQLID